MARRPPHKTAHGLSCPYGVFNWTDCDAAAEHQWGRCVAMVGKTEPEPCTRWAVSEDGYCGQHYISRIEDEKRKARQAIDQLQLLQRIDAHIAWTAEHPSIYDSPNAPRPGLYRDSIPVVVLAAGAGLEPATSRVTTDRSTTELPRKGPHRLTPEEVAAAR